MQWPVWIPVPNSWLRAFGLTIWLSIIGRITGFWGGGLGVVISAISGHLEPLVVLGLLGLLSPFILLAYGHHLLWGKTEDGWPRWLPSKPSLKEGAYALVVVLGATTVGAILVLPFVNWDYSYYRYEALANWFTVIWLTSAAYIYHTRQLHRFRRAAMPVTPRPGQPKVDDIDVELNQLRATLGLHKMKTPKRSNPTTPDD